ncbi:hypothetical protein H4R18_004826 [Coemansia javaensis]|uniref:alpha-1,2-Mannosidase n=1 Tax=Coemansia javaensis TaxID=2761396 RepID=A0A9W8LGI0_9FUNG|nr:hypothetical protein H4R18_004826 [Coemansia javaensis]
MRPLRRVSLRVLLLVCAAVLGGTYVLTRRGVLPERELGSWLDTVGLGALPWTGGGGGQHSSAAAPDRYAADQQRLAAVRRAMAHAWKGYRDHAFGQDELQPLTRSGNVRWGNWSVSLVDALDTLYLMGMRDEYAEAKAHVQKIDFTRSLPGRRVSVFEMTIRALGGLLGAYELDHDPALLAKAVEVGNTLAMAFASPTGLPYSTIDLSRPLDRGGPSSCIAEAGTLQLEFKKLSQLTGNRTYADLAHRAFEAIEAGERPVRGLYPSFIDVNTGRFEHYSGYSVSAYADSFYEYLLKQHILHNLRRPEYGDRYVESVEAVKKYLVGKTPTGLTYLGTRTHHEGALASRMDHLACFYPGLLALGAQVMDRPQDLGLAEALARTCYLSYKHSPTGLGPETFSLYTRSNSNNPRQRRAPPPSMPTPAEEQQQQQQQAKQSLADLGIGVVNPKYILRPETIESLFVLHRITGNPVYREWGWDIFQAIEKYTRVEHGYAAYADIENTSAKDSWEDSMESFFLAETLKYLYLLFAPHDLLPLDKFVLNTEAHPLRIMPS